MILTVVASTLLSHSDDVVRLLYRTRNRVIYPREIQMITSLRSDV